MSKCIICNTQDVDDDDICDTCGWQQDSVQNRLLDFAGGANVMSANEAKTAWENGEKIF